jgi:hypothetical protein
MKTFRYQILLPFGVFATALIIASLAWAQMGPGMRCGRGYYDASNETAIHGVVETVQENAAYCRWGGTEVTLKADKDTYVVQLGPTPFLSQNNFNIAKGDEVRVSGFKFTCQGTTFLIAQNVTKGSKTLTLRDAQGFPAWAGRGKGWSSPSGWGGVRGWLCCGCRCRCWWPKS